MEDERGTRRDPGRRFGPSAGRSPVADGLAPPPGAPAKLRRGDLREMRPADDVRDRHGSVGRDGAGPPAARSAPAAGRTTALDAASRPSGKGTRRPDGPPPPPPPRRTAPVNPGPPPKRPAGPAAAPGTDPRAAGRCASSAYSPSPPRCWSSR